MSVISVRLNKNEEEMLKVLTLYYEKEKSALIKHSLRELYEDLIDKREIDEFEEREARGNTKFISSDEIRTELGQ